MRTINGERQQYNILPTSKQIIAVTMRLGDTYYRIQCDLFSLG